MILPGDQFKFQAEDSDAGQRLDVWISRQLGADVSRSQVQKWIQCGQLTGDSEKSPPVSYRIRPGDHFQLSIPAPLKPLDEPVDLKLKVLFEDEHLAIIHKPPGLATHPGPGERRLTLINGLLHLWSDLPGAQGDLLRPGIVHRLDRDTEGILVVARHSRALRELSALFSQRAVEKDYLAWLAGSPPTAEGSVDEPIRRHPTHRTRMIISPDGRPARTGYRIETTRISRRGRKFAFVRIRIHTGRTHQIRIHMASLRAPVVGDSIYGKPESELRRYGMLLLAHRLAFKHPLTGASLDFQLDLPERFQEFAHNCERY